jgi:DNA-directed RNA polymerase specialized sigma24 family protein
VDRHREIEAQRGGYRNPNSRRPEILVDVHRREDQRLVWDVVFGGITEPGFERAENAHTLRRAMGCLTARQTEVLTRHDLGDERLIDIADDLGVTEAAVCTMRQRALKRVREHLAA